MWATILFCAIFVLQVILNVLVRIFYEDLGEDSWYCTHVHSTLIKKLSVAYAKFPPRLRELFSVLMNLFKDI